MGKDQQGDLVGSGSYRDETEGVGHDTVKNGSY